MTEIEVVTTNTREIAIKDSDSSKHPQSFHENLKVAKRGGMTAQDAKKITKKYSEKKFSKNLCFPEQDGFIETLA